MRNFLYSEIEAFVGIGNAPLDPHHAIRAGHALVQTVLDPLVKTFGPIKIRSAYRSPEVNDYGAGNWLGCAAGKRSFAAHIWDVRDGDGNLGA